MEHVTQQMHSRLRKNIENLILHQVGKENPTPLLKEAFPCKFHGIKIVPTLRLRYKV
jgi:hypothetical protein